MSAMTNHELADFVVNLTIDMGDDPEEIEEARTELEARLDNEPDEFFRGVIEKLALTLDDYQN